MERDQSRERHYFHRMISIHALRMERDPYLLPVNVSGVRISIHALRMERDDAARASAVYVCPISIHALRMERDAVERVRVSTIPVFQSTRSAWSATVVIRERRQYRRFQSTRSAWSATAAGVPVSRKFFDFNPRAPHGARPNEAESSGGTDPISIHALRMERDRGSGTTTAALIQFQSTRSAWSAT